MTLKIQVSELTLKLAISENIYIQAQGTKSGHLISETVDVRKALWDPYFRIDCSQDDRLNLIMMGVSKNEKKELGSSSLVCSKFIKDHIKDLQGEDPIAYTLDVLDDDEIIGQLKIWVMYDSSMLYEGELPSKISLSLSNVANYPIYEGRTSTVNAFSFLDEGSLEQHCKFTESIYRDHQ